MSLQLRSPSPMKDKSAPGTFTLDPADVTQAADSTHPCQPSQPFQPSNSSQSSPPLLLRGTSVASAGALWVHSDAGQDTDEVLQEHTQPRFTTHSAAVKTHSAAVEAGFELPLPALVCLIPSPSASQSPALPLPTPSPSPAQSFAVACPTHSPSASQSTVDPSPAASSHSRRSTATPPLLALRSRSPSPSPSNVALGRPGLGLQDEPRLPSAPTVPALVSTPHHSVSEGGAQGGAAQSRRGSSVARLTLCDLLRPSASQGNTTNSRRATLQHDFQAVQEGTARPNAAGAGSGWGMPTPRPSAAGTGPEEGLFTPRPSAAGQRSGVSTPRVSAAGNGVSVRVTVGAGQGQEGSRRDSRPRGPDITEMLTRCG